MSYTAEEEEADLFPALTRKERWEGKKVEGEKRKTGKGGIKEGGGRELQMEEEERGGKPIIRIGKRKRRRKCLAAALFWGTAEEEASIFGVCFADLFRKKACLAPQ